MAMRSDIRAAVRVAGLLGVLFAVVTSAREPGASAASRSATPTQIIAGLSAEPADLLIDMHGNANRELQHLMRLRFAATKDVMRGIDRMQGDAHDAAMRSALFGVLGFVKDPASIEWLRAQRRSNAENFYRDYLPTWMTRLDGFGSWEWLTARARWIAFWREAFEDERSPARRIELLDVLGQFDDASVVSFFSARRIAATDPKEVLVVESYLNAHAVVADDERVAGAVDALRDAPQDEDFLTSMAGRLRHEAFVPFLIDVSDKAEPDTFPLHDSAERILQAITFACDVHGKPAWQTWYAAHGEEGRAGWMHSAIDGLRAEQSRDLAQAAQHFDKLVHCWNDIALLPFVKDELAAHAQFHSAIAGWINLTYSDAQRERLRPLAEQVGADHQLEPFARLLLQERGYVPGLSKETWAKAVHTANARL
jgi:hypothetical protein